VKKTIVLCLLTCLGVSALAQNSQKHRRHPSLKDSLDGSFDLSDYVVEENGFVPVPYVITEPALGSFGLALAPVFIKKRPPYLDSVKGHWRRTPIAPDITGGAAVYTVNHTWALAAFRSGTLVKSRIKYVVGGGYANVNMSFYKTFSQLGEKQLQFNIAAYPLILQATKRIALSHWYAGLKYMFLKARLRFVGNDSLSTLTKPLETNTLISQLGAIVELDNRDNVFTPDKGIKFHLDAICSNSVLGSDYDFWKLNYYMYGYLPISRQWTGGLRIDGQQILGTAPFYTLPYIDMRGIPAERYQGNATLLSEAELRWDFVRRWSAVFFSGVGTAFDEWNDPGSADWVVSYGAGFRYLLARKFKLRMGIDLAHGPDTWAYYIVFGSNWLR
jgi:hypothetical protein